MPETVKVGPFTWERNPDRNEEQWRLVDAVELIGCIWSVTNYGDAYPDSPFYQWRYGSGGPYGNGPLSSRDSAMRACIPYLLQRMRDRVNDAEARLVRLRKILNEYDR